MTWNDLLWYLPLAVAVSLALGASGREGFRAIARASVQTFGTLLLVVGGLGLAVRLVVLLFV